MAVELRGTLTTERMIEVLRSLKENHFYGTFLISDGILEKCFFFTRGGLRLVAAGREPVRVSDYLFANALISADSARVFSEKYKNRQEVTKYELAEAAGLGPEQIDDNDRQLMAEEFLETLFWPDCYFEFKAGDPDEEAYQNNLSARLLSLGIPKVVDSIIETCLGLRELKRRFDSVDLLVALTSSGHAVLANPSPAAPVAIFQKLAKSAQTIRSIYHSLVGVTEFSLIQQLNSASEAGRIDIQSLSTEEDDQRIERIRRLEDGLDQAISPIMKRQALARSYQKQNDKQMAAQHFKRAGLLMLKSRRDNDASKELRQAVELDPEDFEAKEGLVDALWLSKQVDSARDEAEQLSRKYFDLGLSNRARLVLENAVTNVPRDLGLKNLLVRTYLRLGRSEKALELGRGLCEDLRSVGREEEALGLANRFVDAGVDADRVLVMSGEKRRRLMQKGLMGVAALMLVILLPTILSARSALKLSEASKAVTRLVAAGEYEEAQALLDDAELFGMRSTISELSNQVSASREEFEEFRQTFENFFDEETGKIDWARANDLDTAEESCVHLMASSNPRIVNTAKLLKKSIQDHRERGAKIQEEYEFAYQARDGQRAYQLAKLYFKRYRNLPPKLYGKFESIGMPLQLKLVPSDALVDNLSRQQIKGSGLYFVKLDPKNITVSHPEYQSQTVRIDPKTSPFQVVITLKKK